MSEGNYILIHTGHTLALGVICLISIAYHLWGEMYPKVDLLISSGKRHNTVLRFGQNLGLTSRFHTEILGQYGPSKIPCRKGNS